MSKPRLVRQKHHARLILQELDSSDHQNDFQIAVEKGLGNSPKIIPPKFFYDDRGSKLFEEITQTEDYYPTRTESEILRENVDEILTAAGDDICLVEFGSGSALKTRLLLDKLIKKQGKLEFIPIDISSSIVAENGRQLLKDFPQLHVSGLICDYYQAMKELNKEEERTRLFLFLGSSIGNFKLEEAIELLWNIRMAMNEQDLLLLGVDLIKEKEVLERAYNDAQGVTAAFNLNLLTHINTVLGGHFDLERFRHHAFYNEQKNRIEMHLVSEVSQIIPIDTLKRSFSFNEGESILTEYSYKFDRDTLTAVCSEAGLRMVRDWRDDKEWFSLALLSPS